MAFLSGAAIRHNTRFVDLTRPESLELIETLRYYFQFALASYGWLFYISENKQHSTKKLLTNLRWVPSESQSLKHLNPSLALPSIG